METTAASAGPSSQELLIVGAGALGSRLGKLWLDAAGPDTVVGQTRSTDNHAALDCLGIMPRKRPRQTWRRPEGYVPTPDESRRFPYVAYTAPPSGGNDHKYDLKDALELWDGSGAFVFTSSATNVSIVRDGVCDENSATRRMGIDVMCDRQLLAEQAVVDAGGCVLRLADLYHRRRGRHIHCLVNGDVPSWGGDFVNSIHYEDAASLAVAVLRGQGSGGVGYRSKVFLGCDNNPVTLNAMMDAVRAAGVESWKQERDERKAERAKQRRNALELQVRAAGLGRGQLNTGGGGTGAGGAGAGDTAGQAKVLSAECALIAQAWKDLRVERATLLQERVELQRMAKQQLSLAPINAAQVPVLQRIIQRLDAPLPPPAAPAPGAAAAGSMALPVEPQQAQQQHLPLPAPAQPSRAGVFIGAERSPRGKRMNNDATRRQLQWEPKYSSVVEFFSGGASDWYSSGLAGVE